MGRKARLLSLGLALGLAACVGFYGIELGTDGDGDADSDADGDSGGDTDGDSDGDADRYLDADVDAGTDADHVEPVDADDETGVSSDAEIVEPTDAAVDSDIDPVLDSDGDGTADFIELLLETDPFNASDSPETRGIFYYYLPSGESFEPAPTMLSVSTSITYADFYLLLDSSGSMSDEVEILDAELVGTVLPTITSIVPEAWVGVGQLEDYPLEPYGTFTD